MFSKKKKFSPRLAVLRKLHIALRTNFNNDNLQFTSGRTFDEDFKGQIYFKLYKANNLAKY